MARPQRTRRTRDETRQLLLDAAVRVVLGSSNPSTRASKASSSLVRSSSASRYQRTRSAGAPASWWTATDSSGTTPAMSGIRSAHRSACHA